MSDIERYLPESDRVEEDLSAIDPYDAHARAERAKRFETVEAMIERMGLDKR